MGDFYVGKFVFTFVIPPQKSLNLFTTIFNLRNQKKGVMGVSCNKIYGFQELLVTGFSDVMLE